MRNDLKAIILALFGATVLLLLPSSITYADCTPEDGTNGPDNIVCDNSPAGPFVPDDGVLQGREGDDNITIDGNTTIQGDIQGDGDGSGNYGVNPGSDTITNDGTVTGYIRGDGVSTSGVNDVIINNGSAGDLLGDGATGNGGNDVITNTGTAAVIYGDSVSYKGGADTITNSGEAQAILGDGSGGGGDNDIITNTGTVTGNINGNEGDDQVTILVGSEVGGTISGDDEVTADTLTFNGSTNDDVGWAALEAMANTCAPNCAGTVTFCSQSYTFTNFEALTNAVTLVGENCGVATVSFVSDASNGGTSTSTTGPDEICTTAVKVFRLPNGDLEVYSGFDILVPNGFLVANIAHDMQQVGNTFGNASAPPEGQGWTATLEIIDSVQRIIVRDTAGNIINQDCQW